MSNQELILKNELLEIQLTSEKQRAELAELRNELMLLQAKKASRLEDSLFSPTLIGHYKEVATMLSKSDVVPNCYKGKAADILVAMEMGYQLGFPVAQALQDIAVINGRPCLWGDGLKALALNHPECESIVEEPLYNNDKVIGYRCIVHRKGHSPHTKIFTIKDAEQAGLWGKKGPWTQYPERMLQLRARSFAIRDMFADALRGIKSAEEVEDYIDAPSRRVEEKKTEYNTQTEKLKAVLNIDPIVSNNEVESANDAIEEETTSFKRPEKPSLLKEIEDLMKEKDFDEDRRKKAFEHYNIERLEDLSIDQAKIFLNHMRNIKPQKI